MTTLKEATAALAAWDIQPYGFLKEIHPGSVFKVCQKSGDNLILKDVGERSVERLLFEFDVLHHLANSGVPVAVPLKATNGQQAVSAQGTLFTLSPCLIKDNDPEPGNWEDRIPAYGEAFARLHLSLATYSNEDIAGKTWSSNPLKESFDSCIPSLLRSLREVQAMKLSEITDSMETDMRRALEGLPVQLIHRDLHDGNVICSGDRVVGIVDCDHFSFGTPMIDIAYFLHNTVKWIGEVDGTRVKNEDDKRWWLSWMPGLIQAYVQVRQLSSKERSSLPYVMIWVFLTFADMYCKQRNYEQKLKHRCWLKN